MQSGRVSPLVFVCVQSLSHAIALAWRQSWCFYVIADVLRRAWVFSRAIHLSAVLAASVYRGASTHQPADNGVNSA